MLPNKKAAPPGLEVRLNPHNVRCLSGFPTLVLPRSGCEGRPIERTLSREAPLAIEAAS
ncbi:protein of unknown function [Candidatus Nitrospira inopinata]|uniref:Uncharacterized protein n=1 Tax=Candidatus Nitrospira inopinata TaxID=1715989 RepID=A0A0S4KSZ7_9BACT|nr:protein of unknown function [Candidatus Nitrospira inopinata]